MVESKNIESNNDTLLMLLTVSLLLISIVAFYYFSEIRLFYRVLGLFGVLGYRVISCIKQLSAKQFIHMF